MPSEAIKAYNKAISIKPNYSEAYINLGIALLEQGKHEDAIEANNKALLISPDNAEAFNNLGAILEDQGKLEDAIEAFKKSITLKPNVARFHNNLGNTLYSQGKLKEAIEAYGSVLAINPDHSEAKHLLSSLTGKTNNSAPREYVENLFDEYADKFNQTLAEDLNYNIPEIITELAVQEHGSDSLGSILDLGCGTGLTGVNIKKYCSNLVGIDLSNKMLDQARITNVYNKLSHVDIVEYLSRSEMNYDYFIATDVFIYVGELSEIFRLIKYNNKKHGKLIFSTEHTELDGFHIQKTGRYAHSKSYIERLCKEYHYSISHFSKTNLRKDNSVFLIGGIYILNF